METLTTLPFEILFYILFRHLSAKDRLKLASLQNEIINRVLGTTTCTFYGIITKHIPVMGYFSESQNNRGRWWSKSENNFIGAEYCYSRNFKCPYVSICFYPQETGKRLSFKNKFWLNFLNGYERVDDKYTIICNCRNPKSHILTKVNGEIESYYQNDSHIFYRDYYDTRYFVTAGDRCFYSDIDFRMKNAKFGKEYAYISLFEEKMIVIRWRQKSYVAFVFTFKNDKLICKNRIKIPERTPVTFQVYDHTMAQLV